MTQNTISSWFVAVINHSYTSAMSLFFRRDCTVHQVLKAGTWSSQSTFSSFYLRDVTHRHLDTFSIGPLVAATQ